MATDKQVLVRLDNLDNRIKNLEEMFESFKQPNNFPDFTNLNPMTKEYMEAEENMRKANHVTSNSFVNHVCFKRDLPDQNHYDGFMPRIDKYVGGICIETETKDVKFYLIGNDCQIGFEENYPNSNRSLHKGEFSITIRPLVTDDGEYKKSSLRLYRMTSGTRFSEDDYDNDHLKVQKCFREIKDLLDEIFKGNPTEENVYEGYKDIFKWLHITLNKNCTTTLELRHEVFNGLVTHPVIPVKRIDIDCEIDIEVIEK